jgi:hypothetical protein
MYTHTFEIIFDHVNIQGEVTFANGGTPKIKFNDGYEMEVHEWEHVLELISGLNRTCAECGQITKIEIVKK